MISIGAGEFFYYCFWGILFAAKGMGLEYGQKLFWLCLFAALFCLAGKLLLTEHTVKEWLVICLLVLWGAVIYQNSGEQAALAAALVIVGMKGIPVKRLMKISLSIWSATFFLSFLLGCLHIRDGVVVVHEKLGLGPIIRWSLGYTHPNVLHISYFILVALLLYVCRWEGKRLLAASVVLMAGNLLIFLWSISYTGVLVVSVYLVLNLYFQMRKQMSRVENFLIQCIFPFCVLFPLAGPFLFKGALYRFFNQLLSTRFKLVRLYFTDFQPTLFGTRAYYENTQAKLTLDSSFAYLLMYYGILAFLVFVIGYFLVLRCLLRTGQKEETVLLIGIAVAGITEQFLFNLSFKNLSFFFLGEALFASLEREGRIGWLEQKVPLLSGRAHRLQLPDLSPCLRFAWGFWKDRSRRILCLMAVAAVLSGAVRAATVQMPDSIYVNRWITDYRDEEREVTLDLSSLPENFNSWVLGYDGPETGMYCMKGNIIALERVRAVTGAAVLGGAAVGLGGLAAGCALFFAKKVKRRTAKEGTV